VAPKEWTSSVIKPTGNPIPLDLLKLEQARISSSLEVVTDQLALMVGDQTSLLENLDRLLTLLQQCDVAYIAASPNARRLMNQAFAEKIYIDETGDGAIEAIQVVESISNVVAVAARGRNVGTDEEPPPVTSSALSIPIAHNTKSRSISASGFCVVASQRLFAARSLNKPFWVDLRRQCSNLIPELVRLLSKT
jgi:hypothetical protein